MVYLTNVAEKKNETQKQVSRFCRLGKTQVKRSRRVIKGYVTFGDIGVTFFLTFRQFGQKQLLFCR